MFWRTNHTLLRKSALTFEILYSLVSLVFSWFAVGNLYLTFYLISQQTFQQSLPVVFELLRLAYVATIIAVFICSLGNRPQGAKMLYIGSMFVFGGI